MERGSDGKRAAQRGRNNFDAVRLVAALAVLFSHAFVIAEDSEAHEPLVWLSGNQCGLGLTAVFVFFAVSGFLVTQSRVETPSAPRFLLKRAARLAPGLLVSGLAIGLLLGPLVSSLPLDAYLGSPQLGRYFARTFSLGLVDEPLPGVRFSGSRVGYTVNGSLWTLRYEVMMYLMVALLGGLRLLRPAVAVLLLALGLAALLFEHSLDPLGDVGEWAWMLGFFASGMCLYFWRDHALDGRLAGAAALGLAVTIVAGKFILLFPLFGGYLTIYLALKHWPRLDGLRRIGDLSYGLYIYGWPLEELVVWARGGEAAWWEVFLGALLLALPIAWLSWRFVERPVLRWARGPTPAAAPLVARSAG
jgi:peptidoglycan/LPS O-acetylase OafA/YrhL